ncbi:MAG: FecR domain-containing protein [Odoribacteraceae bacterium]|jgi:ferric-dicitrate binding protein FerR (iron transport regulator)|nr:FecR domain-containing protein [Odoribacteraceae bacterium]
MNVKKIVDKYFAGELPAPLAEKVRAWLLHDKTGDAEKEEALEKAWNRIVKYHDEPQPFAVESFEEIQARLFPVRAPRKKRGSWRLVAQVAAVLLPLLAIGGGTWVLVTARAEQPTPRTVVEASGAATRRVVLSDGTDVVLNASSSLAYSEERKVALDGEAFFKVAKNEKPFVVTAGEVTVTVLGTTFNVEAYPDRERVKVTLFEGKVKLESKHGSRVLNAGEELLFDPGASDYLLTPVDRARRQPEWCAAPSPALAISKFDEILDRIATRYNVSIKNNRPELNEDAYTFLLDEEETLDGTLRVLQLLGQKFTYKVEGNVVTIE